MTPEPAPKEQCFVLNFKSCNSYTTNIKSLENNKNVDKHNRGKSSNTLKCPHSEETSVNTSTYIPEGAPHLGFPDNMAMRVSTSSHPPCTAVHRVELTNFMKQSYLWQECAMGEAPGKSVVRTRDTWVGSGPDLRMGAAFLRQPQRPPLKTACRTRLTAFLLQTLQP